jgi:ABC-2 type transport system permease protein
VRGLVAAELLKLRTTRTLWGLSLLALLLVGGGTVLQLALGDSDSPDELRSVLSNASGTGLIAVLLGVIATAGEYRHGTIGATFLVTPKRERVLLAKALAHGLVALGLGLAGAVLVTVLTLSWLGGVSPELSTGDVALIMGGSVAGTCISGIFGVGLGALLRNQVAAVIVLVVALFVVDPAAASLVPLYGKLSLTGINIALSGDTGGAGGPVSDPLPQAAAGFVYLGYALASLGAGALVTDRRDIS